MYSRDGENMGRGIGVYLGGWGETWVGEIGVLDGVWVAIMLE